jgi:DNA-binding NtrC family response regulator
MAAALWRRILFPGQRTVQPDVQRVLGVTVSADDRACYSKLQAGGEWDVVIAESADEALSLIVSQQCHIVLFDRDLPGPDWRDVLMRIVNVSPHICVLLTSSVSDEFLWREVVTRGGYDVVTKPLDVDAVTHTLRRAWSYWKAKGPPPASTV